MIQKKKRKKIKMGEEQNKKVISLNNMNIINDEYVIIKVNPKIYSLDTVQSAAYVLMDRAFAIIDGDPDKELLVELKPRNDKENLEALGRDFNNELINYAVYKVQSKRTLPLREKIIQRALLTNLKPDSFKEKKESPIITSDQSECEQKSDYDSFETDSEADYTEDPEGIMQSWQERQEKEKEKKK